MHHLAHAKLSFACVSSRYVFAVFSSIDDSARPSRVSSGGGRMLLGRRSASRRRRSPMCRSISTMMVPNSSMGPQAQICGSSVATAGAWPGETF